MYKFSVIVPVYNSEKYLERCLNSILNQTYKNIECIVIDDGSKDNCEAIYKKIAKKDGRLKFIKKENGGVSSARNKGIEVSNGEYIVFVDSDDYIEKNMLQESYNLIKKYNSDIIIFMKSKKSLCMEKNSEEFINKLTELIISEKMNSPWSKIYKSDIIKDNKVRFDSEIHIGEDLLFNIEYFKAIETIYLSANEFYHVDTSNNNSLSRKYTENKYNQLMYVNDEMKKWVVNFGDKKLLNTQKYIRLKNIISCLMDLYHPDCHLNREEKKEYIKSIKKENRNTIITNLGIRIFVLTMLYNIMQINNFVTFRYIRKLKNK